MARDNARWASAGDKIRLRVAELRAQAERGRVRQEIRTWAKGKPSEARELAADLADLAEQMDDE